MSQIDFFNISNIEFGAPIPEVECTMSADAEVEPITNLSLTSSAEFTCDIANIDTSLFGTYNASPSKLCWKMPILIQARWHKKHRINKKWAKRYGMKRDTINAEATITSWAAVPDDNYHWLNSYDFELANIVFKFRPHQMRRDIKIKYV